MQFGISYLVEQIAQRSHNDYGRLLLVQLFHGALLCLVFAGLEQYQRFCSLIFV